MVILLFWLSTNTGPTSLRVIALCFVCLCPCLGQPSGQSSSLVYGPWIARQGSADCLAGLELDGFASGFATSGEIEPHVLTTDIGVIKFGQAPLSGGRIEVHLGVPVEVKKGRRLQWRRKQLPKTMEQPDLDKPRKKSVGLEAPSRGSLFP